MFGEWLWIPLLVTAVAGAAQGAHSQNMAKKEARTQQLNAERIAAQQAKEAEELAKAARTPTAPKQQAMRRQSVPEYSAQASLADLTVRGRRGKAALRVPKSGTGLRIPS